MEWVVLAGAVPLLALTGLWLVGRWLPVHQLARRSRDLPAPPEVIWQVLMDFEAYPRWHRRVQTTLRVPSAPHEELWRESYGRLGLTLRTEVVDPGRVLCRHVVGLKLNFGGVWRFEVEPAPGGGTRLTIIESAELYRATDRLLTRFVLGEGRNLDEFLADMAAELARRVPAGQPARSALAAAAA